MNTNDEAIIVLTVKLSKAAAQLAIIQKKIAKQQNQQLANIYRELKQKL